MTLSVISLRSMPAPPKGGAFRLLPVSRAKPPPFGGGGTAQAVTERVQPARAKQCFPRSAALSQKAALQMPFPSTTPSRENGIAERPQALRYPEIINILSAIYAQSNAERIQNRPPNARPPGAGVKTAPGGHV